MYRLYSFGRWSRISIKAVRDKEQKTAVPLNIAPFLEQLPLVIHVTLRGAEKALQVAEATGANARAK